MNVQEVGIDMKKFGSAIILAGGKSSRMGFDKQLLHIRERRLMDNLINKLKVVFDEIIIVTNKPEYYTGLAHKITQDQIIESGPLGGIHAGLLISSSQYAYVIACDMPNINLEYISYMKEILKYNDKLACVSLLGEWIEPFNGFYYRNLISSIESFLNSNQRAIHRYLKDKDIHCIKEEVARKFSPDWDMFFNINTRDDLNRFLDDKSGI